MGIAPGRLGNFLNSLVRSGFLIGRLVAFGLSNFVIVFGGLIVLAYLDPVSVAVLIVIAILCLPIYAWALLQMVGKKRQDLRKQRDQKALAQKVLEEVVIGKSHQVDTSKMSVDDLGRFEAGYTTVNELLKALNLISFIAGVHVFASIAVIYLINGASLATFVRDKIVFFVVLIFVMRAALALATLLGRFSRNYPDLATLRAYLHPRRKRIKPLPNAPANAVFSVKVDGETARHPVCKGAPVFVVMPRASHAYELLPLSNAIEIVREPPRSLRRYIVFADKSAHMATGCGDSTQSCVIEVTSAKNALKLPVVGPTASAKELGPVALTSEAWEVLWDDGQADEYCRSRIVFVVIGTLSMPKVPSAKSLLVVSDGEDILAAGPFAEIWRAKASEAFENASKKKETGELNEDEEMM
ncbi:MAG: hypothetical protein A49_01090 [Methyloceanibacter sp.]|nr:MAG: hypothetical protein A49_01090 [Methyloceanibacter sp.]